MKMKKLISLVLALVLVLGALPFGAMAAGKFTDVRAGAFYEKAVNWAVENGITAGTSETTFSPDDNCTRAQVVTFLWRAAGKPKASSGKNPFTDVSERGFYYRAVLWAVENGITAGTSATTFSPEDNCTRAQVVTFLWRAAGKPKASSGKNPFTDVSESAFYYRAMLWAVENGVTAGTSNTTFSPEDNCSRGQVVTFLYRAATKASATCQHSYQVVETTEPSCTEAGTNRYRCDKCGNSYSKETAPALGHDLELQEVDYIWIDETSHVQHVKSTHVEASADAGGYRVFQCSRCGAWTHVNDEPVPAGLIDINEAMEAANNLARDCGVTVNYALIDNGQVGYYPGSAWCVSDIEEWVGQGKYESVQDFVDRHAKAEMICTLLWLALYELQTHDLDAWQKLADSFPEIHARNLPDITPLVEVFEQYPGYTVRCYITYLEDNPYESIGGPAYDIVVYYD